MTELAVELIQIWKTRNSDTEKGGEFCQEDNGRIQFGNELQERGEELNEESMKSEPETQETKESVVTFAKELKKGKKRGGSHY